MNIARTLLRLPPSIRLEVYKRSTVIRVATYSSGASSTSALHSSSPLPASHPASSSQHETISDKNGNGETSAFKDTPGPTQNGVPQPKNDSDVPLEQLNESEFQLRDMDYLQDTLTLPTQEQYPLASAELFDPLRCRNPLDSACIMLGLDLNINEVYHSKENVPSELTRRFPNGIFQCSLTIESENVYKVAVTGEGTNKKLARHAAWFAALAEMHSGGFLSRLFVQDEPERPSDDGKPSLVPTKLDRRESKKEKDAILEIWNYAASLGVTPHIDIQTFPKAPLSRREGKNNQPQGRPFVVHMTISLPNYNVEASAVGEGLGDAEIAAAIAFKRQAEDRLRAHHSAMASHEAYGLLSIDTAEAFIDLFRRRRGGPGGSEKSSVTVTRLKKGGQMVRSARVLLRGEQIGPEVIALTEERAKAMATLSAAVSVANAHPELLKDFAETFQGAESKRRSEPLRSLDPSKIDVSVHLRNTMRDAILEARTGGLADSAEALSAVEDPLAKKAPGPWKKILGSNSVERLNQQLQRDQENRTKDTKHAESSKARESLPVSQHRGALLNLITTNTYSIVAGATGSGKTTQIPQIILEHEIAQGRGATCHIVCTQPRRIAATSVAQRVAEERHERLGDSVGYHVRFDAKLPMAAGGTITYCTTGILLEQLKHMPDAVLDRISHIIIDEVHERDLPIDFLMILIKRTIQARREARKPIPKVVLMSATINTELFANYFRTEPEENGQTKPCPSISVPGRTFPVEEKFLGDIMHSLLQSHPAETQSLLNMGKCDNEYLRHELEFSSQWSKRASAPSVGLDMPLPSIDWRKNGPAHPDTEDNTALTNREKEDMMVPCALLAATIARIGETTDDGCILAFLPGLDEIGQTEKILREQQIFGIDFTDTSKWKVSRLHSSVSQEDQLEIFKPTPAGCRRVILSTNIAETSITVPNVRYVVDTGKQRENRFDQIRRITQLLCVWESKSNAKQRAGRAGRVQNGHYYALFSKERHNSMSSVGVPQLLRSDLQETCLAVKTQNFQQSVAGFLSQAIEPPASIAVDAAVSDLKAIEAFTHDERLTKLGRLLSRLPVLPALGKMIILGINFRCLDPMLIFGAASSESPLFMIPSQPEERAASRKLRREFAGREASDHFAMLRAFRELRSVQRTLGQSAARARAREVFVHHGSFRLIDQTAEQVLRLLIDAGLIPRSPEDTDAEDANFYYGPADLNRNSDNSELIKALLLSGNYPRLAARKTATGLSLRTASEPTVTIDPRSVNFDHRKSHLSASDPSTDKVITPPERGSLFIYSEMAKSTNSNTLFLRQTSAVTPLMAVLFGGVLTQPHSQSPQNLTSSRDLNRLDMDAWLPFRVHATDPTFATKLLLEFRKALDRVLNHAFRDLSFDGTAPSTAHDVDVDDDDDDDGGAGVVEEAGDERRRRARGEAMRERFAARVVDVLNQAAGKV